MQGLMSKGRAWRVVIGVAVLAVVGVWLASVGRGVGDVRAEAQQLRQDNEALRADIARLRADSAWLRERMAHFDRLSVEVERLASRFASLEQDLASRPRELTSRRATGRHPTTRILPLTPMVVREATVESVRGTEKRPQAATLEAVEDDLGVIILTRPERRR